jgi:hypothetical protein
LVRAPALEAGGDRRLVLALLESVAGQFYVAVLIANLLGRLVRPSDRMTAPRGSA